MPRRKKILTPTPKMKDAAWRRLHEIVVSPDSPTYSARAAAAAIVRGDADDDDDVKGNAEDAPGMTVVLPRNGRESSSLRTGFQTDAKGRPAPVMIYSTPAELAAIERGLAGEQLALPAPEGRKPALSSAERQRRYREKKRAAAGAVG